MEASEHKSDMFRFERSSGAPVRVGNLTLTPVSRAFQLLLPGQHGGFIWNRPVEVQITEASGETRTLHVHDVTRLLQILVLGIGLFGSILIGMALSHRRDAHD